jgi:hypothetical protein
MNERRGKTQNKSKFCKMILAKMEEKQKQTRLPNLIVSNLVSTKA